MMCIENIMRDLDKADNDASTRSKLVQHLKERIITLNLHILVEYASRTDEARTYEGIKDDYEKKMQYFVTGEDYDLFVTQKNIVLDAFLNTLSEPVDSKEYKTYENEYNIAMIKTMQEIRKG